MRTTASPPVIDRDHIAAAERLIRPYIRHTPVVRLEAADFGLAARPLVLKLEFLQHTGSFKPRGAFANLLTRQRRRRGRRGLGRQSRGRRRLCGATARAARDDLRAARSPRRPSSHAFATTAPTGGRRRGLCRRARRQRGVCRPHRRAGGARLRPAGDNARPRHGRVRARSGCARYRHATGRGRRRRADRRHCRLVRAAASASSGSSRKPRRPCTWRWPPAGRSTRRPAASPPTCWRRARSAG